MVIIVSQLRNSSSVMLNINIQNGRFHSVVDNLIKTCNLSL